MKTIKINECQNNVSGIYKINFPNGKVYIGKSVNIKQRIKEHNSDTRQEVLYLAITKYFKNNIEEFEILEECEREMLSEREKYWIKYYNSNLKEKGYNLTEGGDGAALGTLNASACFSEEDLKSIVKILQETEIPMYKIAEEFGCNRITIERLNAGETYYNSNLTYPIRQQKYVPKSGVLNGNSSLTQTELNSLIYDLKNTNIYMKDLSKKYKVSQSVITNINTGKRYFDETLEYPIRKKNKSRMLNFSQKDLLLIKTMLQNNISMEEIAKQMGCSRKTISNINKGVSYVNSDWNYPIR